MTKPALSFCVYAHSVGARSLSDLRHFVIDGFTDLGYNINFSERIEPGRIALVPDYFAGDAAKRLQDAKVEYVIIATEIPGKHPTSGAFLLNGNTTLDWPLRSAGFAKVAPGAKGILCMDPRPETLEAYRQFGVPVAPLGVGYSPSLHAEMTKCNPEQDLDFAFTGVPTPYRIEIISALRKKVVFGYQPGLLPVEQRNMMLRRARCNLALKLEANWPLPSFTRIMSLLHAERATLSDIPAFPSPPAELVPQCEPVDLIRDPAGLLAAATSLDPMIALEQLKDTRPAKKIVGEAWEQVMG